MYGRLTRITPTGNLFDSFFSKKTGISIHTYDFGSIRGTYPSQALFPYQMSSFFPILYEDRTAFKFQTSPKWIPPLARLFLEFPGQCLDLKLIPSGSSFKR